MKRAAHTLRRVTFELPTDGGSLWTALGSGTRTSGGWSLTGLSLPACGQVRARAFTPTTQIASAGLVETVTPFSFPRPKSPSNNPPAPASPMAAAKILAA